MKNTLKLLVVVYLIKIYNSIRNRHYLTRCALVSPKLSPFYHLLCNGDDAAFIEITGMTRRCFRKLLLIVFDEEEIEECRYGKKRGRSRSLDFESRLGLALVFNNSTLRLKFLCMIFGIVPSVCSVEINSMILLIVEKLSAHEDARVKFPSLDECQHYADTIRQREPLVTDVIGFVDGVKVPVQCGSSEEEQAIDYNGYGGDTYCNNVFLFGPDGKIRWGGIYL